jgi:hypothetical protein
MTYGLVPEKSLLSPTSFSGIQPGMSEREIIPIDEHRAADTATTEADKRREGFRQFLSQWEFPEKPGVLNMETVPACSEGLELLFYFSQNYPTAYEIARARRYQDPPPAVTRTVGWKAYCDHVSGCFECQEGGASPIPYEGR